MPVKRTPLPEERRVAGVVDAYEPTEKTGWLKIGETERIPFSESVVLRAGVSRVAVGASMECFVAPVGGVEQVVGIAQYAVRKKILSPTPA